MKKQQIEALIKKHLLNALDGFKVKGNIVYKIVDDSILHGIYFDSSSYEAKQFSVTIFIQALYVPSNTIDLSIGFRLKDRNKEWWAVDNNEQVTFSEILRGIHTQGFDFFRKASSVEAFYETLKKIKNRSIREQEVITISAIVLNNKNHKEEVNNLIRIASNKENKGLEWVNEICQNVTNLEKADYKKRQEILDGWMRYTTKEMKIII